MAERGGHADKLGGTYEALWAVRQLLRVLEEEEVQHVIIEQAGEEGEGGDLRLHLTDGSHEVHQCKQGTSFTGKWTIRDLQGVLMHAKKHLQDPDTRFTFVSGDQAPELREIALSARDSRTAKSFYRDQIIPVVQRREAFETFCDVLRLNPATASDLTEAWSVLRRTEVHMFQDTTEERRELRTKIRTKVEGNADNILSSLKRFAQEKLREEIGAAEIAHYLRTQGFELRDPAKDSRTRPAIERLQCQFTNSVRDHLIAGELIDRSETQEVLTALNEPSRQGPIFLHGIAGAGKSGVAYELTCHLKNAGVPHLPIRLDRKRPTKDPRQFGRELGLPESPALCLEAVTGSTTPVLILDQLDAVRWTSAHSPDAFDVVKELVREAKSRGVRVVLVCRTHDLTHDQQFRPWKQSLEGAMDVEVGSLDLETIRQVAERLELPDHVFSTKELELLGTIQNLQIWAEIVKATKEAPLFETRRELLRHFWRMCENEFRDREFDWGEAKQLLEQVVRRMDADNVPSAPARLLQKSHRVAEALQSRHILQEADDRISFVHQSYFDDLLVEQLLEDLDAGSKTAREWLGSKERQSLFRREQVRLLLDALRQDRSVQYLLTLQDLLGLDSNAPQIRFHIKQLVLEFMGQLSDLRPDEVDLGLTLADSAPWREHAVQKVFARSLDWFNVLDNRGVLARWLASEDPAQRDSALVVLRTVADKREVGDRLARLLEPYSNKDRDWARRIVNVLPRDPGTDSDELFELRVQMAQQGWGLEHLAWKTLVETNLPRATHLLCLALDNLRGIAAKDQNLLHPQSMHWFELNKVELDGAVTEDLANAWTSLAQALDRFLDSTGYPYDPDDLLTSHGLQIDLLKEPLLFLKEIGGALAESKSEKLTSSLTESVSRTAEALAIEVLGEAELPTTLADWVLSWLTDKPQRLELSISREKRWEAVGRLVERATAKASDTAVRRFEDFLLSYREPDFVEEYCRRAEQRLELARSEGFRKVRFHRSSFGRTAHRLLGRIDGKRRSEPARRRMLELVGKFGRAESSSREGMGGWVGSPIPSERLHLLSDRTWLEIIRNNCVPRENPTWLQMGPDRIGESSPGAYSSDFETATSRLPERFARLALQLPDDTNPSYFRSVLRGLGHAKPPDNLPVALKGTWRAAPLSLMEELIRLPAVWIEICRDREMASAFAHLLLTHRELGWHDDTLALLAEIAANHPDPAPDDWGEPGSESSSAENLDDFFLNCARGYAGYAIGGLIQQVPERLDLFVSAIESLVRDPHPAVRLAGVSAASTVLATDPHQATSWVVAACSNQEILLGTHWVRRFFYWGWLQNLDRLKSIAYRMKDSELDEISLLGAQLFTTAAVMSNRLESEFEACLKSPRACHRQGVARAARQMLARDETRDASREILVRFMDDPDQSVCAEVAAGFRDWELSSFETDQSFLTRFAQSRAFQVDPSMLMHRLSSNEGSLLPFAACILKVCETFALQLAEESRDFSTRIAGSARDLPSLLLRLYEESRRPGYEGIHQQCLDMWDLMLEKRVGSTEELMSALDQA